jgi:hypothetical protein
MPNIKHTYCWVEVWDEARKNRIRAGYIDNRTDVLEQLTRISGNMPFEQWREIYLCDPRTLRTYIDMIFYEYSETIQENQKRFRIFFEQKHQRIFEDSCLEHNKFQLVILKKDDQGPYNVHPEFVEDSEFARFLAKRGFTQEALRTITTMLNITEVWELQSVSDEALDEVKQKLNIGSRKKLQQAVLWSRVEFDGKSLKWDGNI